ncbi:MAG: hypothetical protein BWY31_04743 [Lentisphaerae bacterium ADurb.Bin242]|nr:MAG: hypothetical protein BWY31_04743 [Lentisphaerae bacterium ADurb.Bin242]
MMRETAVRLAVEGDGVAAHSFQNGKGKFAPDAVSAVKDNLQFFRHADGVEDVVLVNPGDILRLRGSLAGKITSGFHDAS